MIGTNLTNERKQELANYSAQDVSWYYEAFGFSVVYGDGELKVNTATGEIDDIEAKAQNLCNNRTYSQTYM